MPGWSTEIANKFICLARNDGRCLEQSLLQELVYLANGHLLSITGQPLTSDRPIALEFGPVYVRLADALAPLGEGPIMRDLTFAEAWPDWPKAMAGSSEWSKLDEIESGVVELVYARYVDVAAEHLSGFTAGHGSACARTFDEGTGQNREIRHDWIKRQFDALKGGA